MNWRLINFIGDDAILENESGKQITYPRNLLSPDYNIGDELTINFSKPGNGETTGDDFKQIINTILKTE